MGLFGKKKESAEHRPVAPPVPAAQKEATFFGKNLKIVGNVSGEGDLIILGSLEGEFDVKGMLQVAETATISGTVKAHDITVKGMIQGTITALNKIHLDSTAKVKGHIHSAKISVMEGAVLDGEIKMSTHSSQAMRTSASETLPKVKPSENAGKK